VSGRVKPGAAMIFIVYNTNDDAVARGYEPWLRETDCPFFNTVPGIAHYANWKTVGPAPFAYFDFMVLTDPARLQDVWFNADMNAFRTEWVRLWGYGEKPLPMHNYSHVVTARRTALDLGRDTGWLSMGKGEPPAGIDTVFVVEGSLARHYAGADEAWYADAGVRSPLGYDWVGFSVEKPVSGDLVVAAEVVARP